MSWKHLVFVGLLALAVLVLVAWQNAEGDDARAMAILSELHSSRSFEDASEMFDEWLDAMGREFGNRHPQMLKALKVTGSYFYQLGDYRQALEYWKPLAERSASILGTDHPETLTAEADLAILYKGLGNLEEALRLERQVLEGRRRVLGPEHLDTLDVETNLAVTEKSLGELFAARDREQRVLGVRTRVFGPDHLKTLQTRENLAGTLMSLGDLLAGRAHQERVLDGYRSLLGPEDTQTVKAGLNLANILWKLDELEAARRTYEAAVPRLATLLGPSHPETLIATANLAVVLSNLGDLEEAERLQMGALATVEATLGAGHPEFTALQGNLAETRRSLGNLESAFALQRDVLDRRRSTLGENHPETWISMHNLALTLAMQGNGKGAKGLLVHLVQLRRSFFGPEHSPKTEEEARTFFALGKIERRLGRIEAAYRAYADGLDAAEAQALTVDITAEVKIRFRSRFGSVYHDAVGLALQLDDRTRAFETLERYRAQSLVDTLRRNRSRELPPASRVHLGELSRIAVRYDQLTHQLHALYPETDPDLLEEQAQLRRRRNVIQGRILDARRAVGDVQEPLDVDGIRAQLDPGTLLLSYSFGPRAVYLFVLDQYGTLDVIPLPVEPSDLWTQVQRLRAADAAPESSASASRVGMGQWLYDKLVAPAAARIDGAERLLVLGDGPLHLLPFASLVRPAEDDPRGWRFLVEGVPIHYVQSATVYAELQGRRRALGAAETRSWVGFGGALYPAALDSGSEDGGGESAGSGRLATLRSAVDRGYWDGLVELPHSGREIREIAGLLGSDAARGFLGAEATEDRFREAAGNARIVHLAVHGLADPEQPMDSFLALSLVGRGSAGGEPSVGGAAGHNGLLQAWEVADLELDADLVVLSACTTAIGPDRGGEGLISLSRAFQIAGARSVLASQWKVDDASTAELMIRFYRHLLAGQSKDEALRSAQLELIRGDHEAWRAPHHWGAFQLIGDWR
ncbi:MAG: CHAT domain-containing tetratricopeptide repeat protein [Acidobacteriota bacterium]